MQSRLKTLRRLVNLYSAIEEMDSIELQRRTSAVRTVGRAMSVEQQEVRAAWGDARGAVLGDDQRSWTMAEARLELGELRQRRLEQIRLEREKQNDIAMEQYAASRMRREQMERIFDDIAAHAEIEDGRRMQSAVDDRFLARRRWTEAQKKDV